MSSIVKVLKLCCISGFDTLNLKKQNKKLNLSCFAVHDRSFANLDCFYGISAVFGQLTVLKCKKCLRGTDKVNITLLYSLSLGLSWETVVIKLLTKFIIKGSQQLICQCCQHTYLLEKDIVSKLILPKGWQHSLCWCWRRTHRFQWGRDLGVSNLGNLRNQKSK